MPLGLKVCTTIIWLKMDLLISGWVNGYMGRGPGRYVGG